MADLRRVAVALANEELAKVPNDKPVVYEVLNKDGDKVYTGSAKRGRPEERLREHLPGGPDPIPGGRKVRLRQFHTIDEAQAAEQRAIARDKPKHNKSGK